jgi:heme/copper-type cytochrome/quinol oxidase subunit 2
MRTVIVILAALAVSGPAWCAEPMTIDVTISEHQFAPAEIHVPAATAAQLRVTNRDATAEEFDSSALKIEKVILPGQTATIRLRPMAPGRFPFMGEFHPDSAHGVVIAE